MAIITQLPHGGNIHYTANTGDGLSVDTAQWKNITCTLDIGPDLAILNFNSQTNASLSTGSKTLCTLSSDIAEKLKDGLYIFFVIGNALHKGEISVNGSTATVIFYPTSTNTNVWVGGFAVIPRAA